MAANPMRKMTTFEAMKIDRSRKRLIELQKDSNAEVAKDAFVSFDTLTATILAVSALQITCPINTIELHVFSLSMFTNLQELHLDCCPPSTIRYLSTLRDRLRYLEITNSGVPSLEQDLLPAVLSVTCMKGLPPMALPSMKKTPVPEYCQWKLLDTLRVANCGVAAIDRAVHFLPAVNSIDLSHNSVSHIVHLQDCVSLFELNLSHNRISVLSNCDRILGNICRLILSHNNIESLDGLNKLYALERIDLARNAISDMAEVDCLCNLPNLEMVTLLGNPMCFGRSKLQYRLEVFSKFISGSNGDAANSNTPVRGAGGSRSTPTLDGSDMSDEECYYLRGQMFRTVELDQKELSYTIDEVVSAKSPLSPNSYDTVLTAANLNDVESNVVSVVPVLDVQKGLPSRPHSGVHRRKITIYDSEMHIDSLLPNIEEIKTKLRSKREKILHEREEEKRLEVLAAKAQLDAALARPASPHEFVSPFWKPGKELERPSDGERVSASHMSPQLEEESSPDAHSGQIPPPRPLPRKLALVAARDVVNAVSSKVNSVSHKVNDTINELMRHESTEVHLPPVNGVPFHKRSSYKDLLEFDSGDDEASVDEEVERVDSDAQLVENNGNENADVKEVEPVVHKIMGDITIEESNHFEGCRMSAVDVLTMEREDVCKTAPEEHKRVRKRDVAYAAMMEVGSKVSATVSSLRSPSPIPQGEPSPRNTTTSPVNVDASARKSSEVSVKVEEETTHITHGYCGDEVHAQRPVFSNLEEYFRQQVFSSARARGTPYLQQGDSSSSMLEASPQSLEFLNSDKTVISCYEKVMAMYEEDVIVLSPGVSGGSRSVSLSNSPKRRTESKDVVREVRDPVVEKPVLLVLTDVNVYFIVNCFRLHKDLKFVDAPMPIVFRIHPIRQLKLCTIFFGFQRCVLNFVDSVSEEGGGGVILGSQLFYGGTGSYVILPREKSRTYAIVTKFPQVANSLRFSGDAASQLPKVVIWNNDSKLLDAVIAYVHTLGEEGDSSFGGANTDIVQYQMCFLLPSQPLPAAYSMMTMGNVECYHAGGEPRSLILTPSFLLLCEETLDCGVVDLKVIDYATYNNISLVTDENPFIITICVKKERTFGSLLSKTKKWRLSCLYQSSLNRLVEELRRLCLEYGQS